MADEVVSNAQLLTQQAVCVNSGPKKIHPILGSQEAFAKHRASMIQKEFINSGDYSIQSTGLNLQQIVDYDLTAWSPMMLNVGISLLPAIQQAEGLLWQDSGMTIPAQFHGDPINKAQCSITGLIWAFAEGNIPKLYYEGNDKWSFDFEYTNLIRFHMPSGAASAWTEAELCVAFRNGAGNVQNSTAWGLGEGNWFPYGGDGQIYEDFGSAVRFAVVPVVNILNTDLLYGISKSASATTLRINSIERYSSGPSVIGWNISPYWGGLNRLRGLVVTTDVLSPTNRSFLESYMTALQP